MSESSHSNDKHDHLHRHPDGEDSIQDVEALDPASRALAEALRISFLVLKLVMIGVIAVFILSGFYKVEENEVAVVLRFGELSGASRSAIKDTDTGLEWAFPSPIDEVIKIPGPKAVRTLNVTDFWYYQSDREKVGLAEERPSESMQLLRDGYSLTASRTSEDDDVLSRLTDTEQDSAIGLASSTAADYNLVHSEWQIRYRVIDPLPFLEHLWDGTKGSAVTGDGWYAVDQFLRSVLADAVTVTSANRTLYSMIWDKDAGPLAFRDAVARRMAQRLRAGELGLAVELDLVRMETPFQVKQAFDFAASARSQANTEKTAAGGQASRIVSQAQAGKDTILAQARAYKTSVTRAAQSDAEYMTKVLNSIKLAAELRVPDSEPDYQAQRRQIEDELLLVTVDELYQEVLGDVMENVDETFVLNSTDGAVVEWRPMLNRDAELPPREQRQSPQSEQQKRSPLTRPSQM